MRRGCPRCRGSTGRSPCSRSAPPPGCASSPIAAASTTSRRQASRRDRPARRAERRRAGVPPSTTRRRVPVPLPRRRLARAESTSIRSTPPTPMPIAWLANLIWPGPDHDRRVARLRAAAAIAASDPPRDRARRPARAGDGCRGHRARGRTLVVFHSAVLLYLDADERRRFADLMAGLGAAIGRRRGLAVERDVSARSPRSTRRCPTGRRTDHRFVQTWNLRPIALAGQHGAVYETSRSPLEATAVAPRRFGASFLRWRHRSVRAKAGRCHQHCEGATRTHRRPGAAAARGRRVTPSVRRLRHARMDRWTGRPPKTPCPRHR